MNLVDVKELANEFLHLPMEQSEFSPTIIYHPFFSSAFLYDDKGLFNAFEEQERYNDYINSFYNSTICKCNDVQEILYLIRKSYRLTFLKFLQQNNIITINECGNLLAKTWTLIEIINNDVNVSKAQVLKWISNADKNIIMSKNDFEVYNGFPDNITVYRGVKEEKEAKGISWTTDKSVGKYFATRFSNNGILCEAIISKANIIAYTDRRNEREIILNYKKLKNIKFSKVSR